jgi:mono/diheme cytochrome c family protein
MKRIILIFIGILLVLLIFIQFIPVSQNNPAVTREVNWDTPQTRELAKRACFDCHSNETVWPWYSNIAPVSLILANHVHEGREGLNFSQWDQPNTELEEVEEVMEKGEMPLWDYLLMHSEAKLTSAESKQLLSGLRTTFQQDPPIIKERENREREYD